MIGVAGRQDRLSSPNGETISERYRRIGTFTHGFDYLRILLAIAVVLSHSPLSSYGYGTMQQIWRGWGRIFFAPILPMFFALSGFLVSGSLKKNPTVTSFLTLRAIRLVPALAVEVLLSAILLGPAVTTFPIARYFKKHAFFEYLLNIVGHIHYALPGVFATLPFDYVVNISLWTIPYELECYAALMLLYMLGFIRTRGRLLILTGVAVLIGTVAAFWRFDPYWATTNPLPRSLVVAFLAGVLLNLYADRVRLGGRLAALALAAMIGLTLTYQTIYLAVLPAAYLTVYLGMTHPPKRTWLLSGDYSYGLYLFAFPLQQTYTHLFPGARHWWLNAPFAIVLGLAYAAFSWWCVEKPLLEHKRRVVALAETARDRILSLAGREGRGRAQPTGERVG